MPRDMSGPGGDDVDFGVYEQRMRVFGSFGESWNRRVPQVAPHSEPTDLAHVVAQRVKDCTEDSIVARYGRSDTLSVDAQRLAAVKSGSSRTRVRKPWSRSTAPSTS